MSDARTERSGTHMIPASLLITLFLFSFALLTRSPSFVEKRLPSEGLTKALLCLVGWLDVLVGISLHWGRAISRNGSFRSHPEQ